MKSEYLIEFLPPELRRQTFVRASRRRSALLAGLLIALAVGVAAHSWNIYRKANIDRQISMQVCTNSTKVDDVVNKLAADQQALSRFLGVYDQLAIPLDTSDIIATITHLMPDKMSLAMIKLEVVGGIESSTTPGGAAQGTQAGGASKPNRPAPVTNPKTKDQAAKTGTPAGPAQRPARWINATIRGYAAGNADLYNFERRLSRTTPLVEVTVTDNKPTEVPGSNLQEFTITCRIPLNARYEHSGSGLPPADDTSASRGGAE